MLKSLPKSAPHLEEPKNQPSQAVINAILNYSKGLEVKKMTTHKILIHLN